MWVWVRARARVRARGEGEGVRGPGFGLFDRELLSQLAHLQQRCLPRRLRLLGRIQARARIPHLGERVRDRELG